LAVLTAAPVSANTAAPRAVSAADDAETVPTRIEGFIRLVDGQWLVENTIIAITPQTGINERRGRMEAGPWVAVWGDMAADTVTADVLHVLRPTGSAAPPLQFVGVLTKFSQNPQFALVSGTEVYYDEETLRPTEPPLYAQVRVTGSRQGVGVFALSIEVLAVDADQVAVNLEGTVERAADGVIVVDGRSIILQAADANRIKQGDWVQVRALVASDGTLVAERIEVIDLSREARLDAYVNSIEGFGEDESTWEVVTFETGRPLIRHVLVADDTYVGEDRASIQPEIEAFIDGSKVNAVDVKAEMIWLDQPAPAENAGRLLPGMADGLWSLNGQPVYLPSNELAEQARVARSAATVGQETVVVTGVRLRSGVLVVKSVRAATKDDAARLAAPAGSRSAIASVSWVGPTSVVSDVNPGGPPTLLLSESGAAHLVYESNGFIYHMVQAPREAWGTPKKLAKGAAPTAIFDAAGTLHVTYVSSFLESSDIYHVMLKPGSQWTLPKQVSSTSGSSNAPALAADKSGGLYVAWTDHTSGAWMVHTGQFDGKFWINYPVPNANGSSPSLAVLRDGNLFVAWHARVPTPADSLGILNIFGSEQTAAGWFLPVNISDNASYSPGSESKDPSLVAGPDGNAHLGWIDGDRQPRYDFGRDHYWPAPVNLGPKQARASGLTLHLGADNMLFATWDDQNAPQLTSAPLGAQVWPAAEPLPGPAGSAHSASLALSGRGMAVAWVQDIAQTSKTIYEARSGLAGAMLKTWIPFAEP
jgi:hypothetical protein